MKDVTIQMYYERDITPYKGEITERLSGRYPEATIEVGGDLVSLRMETNGRAEMIASNVKREVRSIIEY